MRNIKYVLVVMFVFAGIIGVKAFANTSDGINTGVDVGRIITEDVGLNTVEAVIDTTPVQSNTSSQEVYPGPCCVAEETIGATEIAIDAEPVDNGKIVPPVAPVVVSHGGGGGYIIRPVVAVAPVNGKVLGVEKFNFTLLLKKGLHNNEVLELQKFLNAAGYDCGTADGYFGPKTKAGVIKFQIAKNLKADGIVGQYTRAELNK